MDKYTKPKSVGIGFCICANCGWTDNKFNWHTYFKCPECGSNEYVKEDYCAAKRSRMDSNDVPDGIFSYDNVLLD